MWLCWCTQDYVSAAWCCWHSCRLYGSDMPRFGCLPVPSVSKCVCWGGGSGWVWEVCGRGFECEDCVCVCVCKSLRAGSGGPAGSLWLHCALWVSGLAQILCTATAGTWVPTKLELPDTHMYKHGHVGLDRKSKRWETVYVSLCLIWVVLCCVRLRL